MTRQSQLTIDELASLMKTCAGITADPRELESRPDSAFSEYGLDSLGLLGIVAELEKRHGRPLPSDAEKCKTPDQFMQFVNTALA